MRTTTGRTAVPPCWGRPVPRAAVCRFARRAAALPVDTMSRFVGVREVGVQGCSKAFVCLVTAARARHDLCLPDGRGQLREWRRDLRLHPPSTGRSRTPVTFSSCKPIRVEINLDGVDDPGAAQRIMLSAMGEVSAASGLQLQYVGPTTPPTSLAGPHPHRRGRRLAGARCVRHACRAAGDGGEGRPRWRHHASTRDVVTYVTGTVAVETDYFNGLPTARRAGTRTSDRDARARARSRPGARATTRER